MISVVCAEISLVDVEIYVPCVEISMVCAVIFVVDAEMSVACADISVVVLLRYLWFC